jgi:hypothetical protein
MNQRKADRKRVIPARRFIYGLLHDSKRLIREATQPQGAGEDGERVDAIIKAKEVGVEGANPILSAMPRSRWGCAAAWSPRKW